MQVTLIRHSTTAGNAARRYIGRTDEPLSEEGLALARQAESRPDVSDVYVTPLQRTRQTAAILFPNAVQHIVSGLREMDFGDFEGRSCREMENDAAYRAWVAGNCLAPCPNGESREAFSARVCAAFEKVLTGCAAQRKETVFFVVHGGTIMAILERFAYPNKDYYEWAVRNCQGYCCRAAFSPLSLTVLGGADAGEKGRSVRHEST